MRYFYYLLLQVVIAIPLKVLSQSITFSPQRGFYTTPFQLSLSSSIGGTIRYTTNGTAPTSTTGTVYSGPITIDSTTVIRAISANGTVISPVTTNTYLFLDKVIKQPANIPGWPNTAYDLGQNGAQAVQDYEMDPKVVNDPAYSGQIIAGLKDIPTLSIVMDKNDFLTMYNGDAEFPTSAELIYPNSPQSNEQFNCGIESHSWLRQKRSMRLVINKNYFPSGLKSNILKNAPLNGANAVDFFTKAKIVLRAGNNRSWARNWNPDRTCYTRDQWYRDAQIDVSGIGSHGTFVHLYINGLYWGLFNPAERLDADWEAAYMGGKAADWMEFSQDGIRSGDTARFNYLTRTLIAKDLTQAANYNEVKGYLDLANFSDYLMLSWMNGMQDWPENNYAGGNRNNPVGPNMFFAWDAEWSWDNSKGSNNGAWVHPAFRNDKSGIGLLTNLWHSLRTSNEFMTLFADRVYRNCFNNGKLTDSVSRARWQTLNNYISKAIIGESARWGDALGDGITRTKNGHWQPEVDRVDGLMNGNVQRFITALRAQGYYPIIDPPKFSKEGGIKTSGLQLTMTNPNSGGTIYYTTNGEDPRLTGGALSSSAIAYTGAINLSDNVTIKARVKNGTTWSALHEGTYTTPNLKINEFMASNVSTVKDEFGVFDDWIEIYNAGTQPVDIGGMYITDVLSNPTQYKIPATNPTLTTIAPHGYIILWADKELSQGPLHVDIKLSAAGEQLGLAALNDGKPVYLDSLSFGPQTDDVSIGRFPDGSSQFKSFTVATPGKTNIVVQKPKGLYINEVLVTNTTGKTDEAGDHDSWIEIYNKNTQPVNIGGLYLTNSLANPTMYQIPANQPNLTTIPANGFIVLWADNQVSQGTLHLGFSLTATTGAIGLVEKIGTDINFVDSFRYSNQLANISLGRYPDASTNFKSFGVPTPGASNIAPSITGLFINEFIASNATGIKDENGENDDWIEIYNSNSSPVDIGGLFITDNLANPGKWQIPTTRSDLTTIPAKGFKLLFADEQTDQGVLHTNIKLSAGGEQIGLVQINSTDTTFIDSLSFGIQKTDTSLGRYPNGGPNIINLNHPTPGASNDTIPNDSPSLTFTLINSTTDRDIQLISDKAIFDISKLGTTKFNIRANPLSTTQSVLFNLNLSAKQIKTQMESSRPFSLFGDTNGNYNDWSAPLGVYTLKATPYSGVNGGGTAGTPTIISFSIINGTSNKVPIANAGTDKTITTTTTTLNGSGTDPDGSINAYSWSQLKGPNTATFNPGKTTSNPTVSGLVPGNYLFALVVTDNSGQSSKADSVIITVSPDSSSIEITSISLINSTTDTRIQALSDGMVLNLATLPSRKLNIRADVTTSNVSSVAFKLSGSQTKSVVENGDPYSLFGDNSGNYADWIPNKGAYTLTATPYFGSNGLGTAGKALTINFSVIDQVPGINSRLVGSGNPEIKRQDVYNLKVYPLPSLNGQYTVSIPKQISGELKYTLVSAIGRTLRRGVVQVTKSMQSISFNFSPVMSSSGVYYLLLEGKQFSQHVSLVKTK